MADEKENSNSYFPWICLLIGFFLSLISIHFFGPKKNFFVREISIGCLGVLIVAIALLKAYKIIDIHDPEFKRNRPWWFKLIFQVVNVIIGHALGYGFLTFISQLLN